MTIDGHTIIFGVFDDLHDGHRFFINEALSLGGQLTIVLAPDEVVEEMKGIAPEYTFTERTRIIKEEFPHVEVVQGDMENNTWHLLDMVQPATIAFGYDQGALREAIEAYYADKIIKPHFVSFPDHRGDELHSSILRKQKE